MIYFFHHYELPAILQQIRIQEMLLQNQQAGQNQTALQDNLNNNNSAPAVADPGPPGTDQSGAAGTDAPAPQAEPLPPSSAEGAGEDRAELNWVAQTAAIITEALTSSVSPGGAGGQGSAGADVNVEFSVGGAAGGEALSASEGAAGGGAKTELSLGNEAEPQNEVELNQAGLQEEAVEHQKEAEPRDGAGFQEAGLHRGVELSEEAELSDKSAPPTECPAPQTAGTDCECREPEQQQQSPAHLSSS